MKRLLLCGVAALSLAAVAAPAFANQFAYVAQNNPWGQTSNDSAMDVAFGSGNWDRLTSYSDAMFAGGYSFIFVDGGDSNGAAFSSWLNGGGSTAAESYVTGGGALFLNAAQNSGGSPTATGFGSQLNYGPNYSNVATVNAAGIAAGLDVGAGVNFTGTYFSHDAVSGGGLTSLIDGSSGVILADGDFGAGHLTVGGETTVNFHSGTDPFQLRVNELEHAALGGTGGVPEPASWALMLTGFFGLGSALRRRRAVALAA